MDLKYFNQKGGRLPIQLRKKKFLKVMRENRKEKERERETLQMGESESRERRNS